MTKRVRIENADTSGHVLRITTQDKIDGKWVDAGDTRLANPTEMVEVHVHAGRRYIVGEAPPPVVENQPETEAVAQPDPAGNPAETEQGTQA